MESLASKPAASAISSESSLASASFHPSSSRSNLNASKALKNPFRKHPPLQIQFCHMNSQTSKPSELSRPHIVRLPGRVPQPLEPISKSCPFLARNRLHWEGLTGGEKKAYPASRVLIGTSELNQITLIPKATCPTVDLGAGRIPSLKSPSSDSASSM